MAGSSEIEYRVSSVKVAGYEDLHRQPQAQLRIMWDADSVPYTSAVMAAVVNQLGQCRVQSVDVFATGATAAALCTGAATDSPAGAVSCTCACNAWPQQAATLKCGIRSFLLAAAAGLAQHCVVRSACCQCIFRFVRETPW